jgi:hypothetical protein
MFHVPALFVAALGLAGQPASAPIDSPFSLIPDAQVPGLRALTIDQTRAASLRARDHAALSAFPLPDGRAVNLSLHRIKPFADDAVVVLSRVDRAGKVVNRPIERADVDCFAGTIDGEADSRVLLTFWDGGQAGWINSNGRTFYISSGPRDQQGPAAIYDPAELPEGRLNIAPFECAQEEVSPTPHTPVSGKPAEGGVAGEETPPCRRVRMAIETDWQYLAVANQGDVFRAQAYAGVLFSAVSEIYRVDLNSSFEIGYLRLWESSDDPWNAGSTGGQLGQFQDFWVNNMADVPRDLAHFLSGRQLGGGVAWLSAVCDPELGFGLSANLAGHFPYPLVLDGHDENWDVMVVAHEIGHNFGAPHTHSYSPPLDGCGLGDCSDADEGTIMSYCHTCEPGMENINMYFHPENVITMLDYLEQTCDLTALAESVYALDDFVAIPVGASVAIDVLANDEHENCNAVEIVAFDTAATLGGAVALSVGTGADGQDELVYAAPADLTGVDTFTYTVEGVGGSQSTATVSIDLLTYRDADQPGNVEPGVEGFYYALNSPSVLPDFSTLSPFKEQISPAINFPSSDGIFAGSGLIDNVGAVFEGLVEIPATAIYAFFVSSDDGSRLYVGDELVVDNDGLHGMLEKPGTIGLKAGFHRVRVEFFEAGGGAGLVVSLAGGPIEKDPIPASSWVHEDFEPEDLNQDGFVDGADLGLLLAQWNSAGPADFNNDNRVDGEDLGILLAAWTS